jgi:hypothetical protein
MNIIERLRVRGNSDIADGYEDKTERGQFDLEVVAELVRLQGEVDRLQTANAIWEQSGPPPRVPGSALQAPQPVPHEHRWSKPHDCGDPKCTSTGEMICLELGCVAWSRSP